MLLERKLMTRAADHAANIILSTRFVRGNRFIKWIELLGSFSCYFTPGLLTLSLYILKNRESSLWREFFIQIIHKLFWLYLNLMKVVENPDLIERSWLMHKQTALAIGAEKASTV